MNDKQKIRLLEQFVKWCISEKFDLKTINVYASSILEKIKSKEVVK